MPVKLQNQPRLTYKNTVAICQLTSSLVQADTPQVRTHEFACADLSTVDTEYNTTENLLNLYLKNDDLSTFTHVTRFTKTEDDKSYTNLTLIDDGTQQHSLLFATAGNTQEYIGDFQTTDEKYSNGKYSIDPEMTQKINDPKYGSFLSNNFIGGRTQ